MNIKIKLLGFTTQILNTFTNIQQTKILESTGLLNLNLMELIKVRFNFSLVEPKILLASIQLRPDHLHLRYNIAKLWAGALMFCILIKNGIQKRTTQITLFGKESQRTVLPMID